MAGTRVTSPGSVDLDRHRFHSAGLGTRVSISYYRNGSEIDAVDETAWGRGGKIPDVGSPNRLSIESDWSFFDDGRCGHAQPKHVQAHGRLKHGGLMTRSEPTLRVPRLSTSFADTVWRQKIQAKRNIPEPEVGPAEWMLANTLLKQKEMANRGGGRKQWTPRLQHTRPSSVGSDAQAQKFADETGDLNRRAAALEAKLRDKIARRQQWLNLWSDELHDLGWQRLPTEGKRGLLTNDTEALPPPVWTGGGQLVRGRNAPTSVGAIKAHAAAHEEQRAAIIARNSTVKRTATRTSQQKPKQFTRPARAVPEITSRLSRCRPLTGLSSSLSDGRPRLQQLFDETKGSSVAGRGAGAGAGAVQVVSGAFPPPFGAETQVVSRWSVKQALSAVDRLSAEQERERRKNRKRPIKNPWWIPGGGQEVDPPKQYAPDDGPQAATRAAAQATAIQVEMSALQQLYDEQRPASRHELAAALGMVSAARGALTGDMVENTALVREVLAEALKPDLSGNTQESGDGGDSTELEGAQMTIPDLESNLLADDSAEAGPLRERADSAGDVGIKESRATHLVVSDQEPSRPWSSGEN